MGIKIDQETNTRPMEKELAQSDLPSKRKVTEYHIRGKGWVVLSFEDACFFLS